MKVSKVAKESLNITDDLRESLKEILPQAFTEGKIDFEKLKTLLGGELADKEEKYTFSWAGRKDAFKNIQTTAKGTLIPTPKESVKFDSTENLFIEGDNLEVLKLLQKSYGGKVKMIYIDPPYNTGKDFVYKDNFKNTIQGYLEQTGQVDEDGLKLSTNPETNGRFHSDWLSMMYPRLFVARNLLRDDGVIFVSIDDNEVHNLRMIMNEIFGEENFVGSLKRRAARKTANLSKDMSDLCDYIMIYSRGELSHPLSVGTVQDNTRPVFNEGNKITTRVIPSGTEAKCEDATYPSGKYKTKTISFELLNDVVVKKGKTISEVSIKGPFRINQKVLSETVYITRNFSLRRYLLDNEKNSAKVMSDLLDEKEFYNEVGTEKVEQIFDIKSAFNNPKPYQLIQHLIKSTNSPSYSSSESTIILDFFAGSGTTAHAVLDLNKEDGGKRKFICVQLPEKTDEKSEAFKAGYKTIADIAAERIRRVIKNIEKESKDTKQDLGFKLFKLNKSNYKIWENYSGQSVEELKSQMKLFTDPLIKGYDNKNVIYECMLKEGYSLNATIEKVKSKSHTVYKVTDGDLFFFISLDKAINTDIVDELELDKKTLFICLDHALDDSSKTNLSLQCNLKTI